MFKKINNYFFGEETITTHDFVWFYGLYALAAVFGIFFIAMQFINASL